MRPLIFGRKFFFGSGAPKNFGTGFGRLGPEMGVSRAHFEPPGTEKHGEEAGNGPGARFGVFGG